MKDISKRASALVTAALALTMLPLTAQAIVIDNGIPEGTVGHWSVDVQTGGSSRSAVLTTPTISGDVRTVSVLNAYLAFVDPGNDGGGFVLEGSAPVLESGVVSSSGSFPGASGTINWVAFSVVPQGAQFLVTSYTFDVASGAIGPLRVYQYFDGDIESAANDVFQATNTFGPTLETRDSIDLFGGSISTGSEFAATFIGGAADSFGNIGLRITGAGQPVSPGITVQNLPAFQHPQLGPAFGPGDIESVLAWEADPNAGVTQIDSFLDGRPLSGPPIDTDFDNDGVPDISDNCPAVSNPNQADSDADGAGDVCDSGPVGPGPDTDGDRVPDSVDQCAGTPVGTAVQPNGCPPGVEPDFDNDGVPNVSDNCPAVRNPSQSDSDGDGAGDVCDSRPNGEASSILNANKVRCNGRRCDVRLACDATTACNNTAVIVVAKRALRTSGLQRDGLKVPTVTMAAGVANTPPGATGRINMLLNRAGRQVFRANRGKRVEAIMRIADGAGRLLSETPIRLRVR